MHDKPPFCWCHDDTWRSDNDDADDTAAADEPQEGETYTTTWDELLFMMTNGEMGTQPPETPQRYDPPRKKHPQR
jgi:hypothetical protein